MDSRDLVSPMSPMKLTQMMDANVSLPSTINLTETSISSPPRKRATSAGTLSPSNAAAGNAKESRIASSAEEGKPQGTNNGVTASSDRKASTASVPGTSTVSAAAVKRNDPLRNMLHFKTCPSEELCEFYDFLKKKEHSEENLEFWLVLRNLNLMYKRYRQIKEEAKQQQATGNVDKPAKLDDHKGKDEGEAHKYKLMDVMSVNGIARSVNVSKLHVDKDLLRKTASQILDKYLTAGAPREINLSNSQRQRVRRLIVEERRYDPMAFAEVRESTFEMMKKDSYPRFLKSREKK
jgi:hypothetical protein